MSDAFLSTLERAYRCQIHGVKPKRNVVQVRTNRGVWIVKGYKERESAYWVTQLANLLRDQGFHRTVHYVSTNEGLQVIPHGEKYYTVMKAIDGQEANYSAITDVKKAATSLAQFHQAAQGIPFVLDDYYGKPPILEKWGGRIQHFEKITRKIASRGPENRFEGQILQLAKEVMYDAYSSVEELRSLPVEALMYNAYQHGTLAHRDVASHNFLITGRGSCYLIDLDTVHSDMQLVDLAQFMSRMMLMQGYQMNVFIDALHAYTKVNSLTDAEIKILITMLQFPDNVLREVTGVYAKRPGYRVRSVTQLLQLKRKFFAQRNQFLKQANRTIQYWKAAPAYYGAS